LRLEH